MVRAVGDPSAQRYEVKVSIRNTGPRQGTTLVQLYTRQRVAAVSQPEKQLRGFTRLTLKAGEEKEAVIALNGSDLDFWLTDTQKTKASGVIEIMTGPDAGSTKTTQLLLPKSQ